MHGGQGEGICDFGLGKGELAAVLLNEADRAQSQEQLAKEVSRARERGPLPYVDEPFARNCLFHQSCLPQGAGETGRLKGDLP